MTIFSAQAGAGDLQAWREKVHPRVLQEATASAGLAEFLIFLEAQADLSSIPVSLTKQERGRRVFDTLTDTATRTQASLVAWLVERGVTHRTYWIANMIRARADLDTIAEIASRADVRRLDANPTVHLVAPAPETPVGAPPAPAAVEWNIQQVHADDLWAMGYTGQGVVIAGHDTGYEWDHPALIGQYRGWDGISATHDYNWRDAIHTGGGPCGHDSPVPCDDIDHGTHTMGIMVGDDGGANQIGMAPGARWIGCRNMRNGDGSAATYSECLEFFVAPTDSAGNSPDPSLAPHVINNSWTCPTSEGCSADTLQTVVNNTRAAGIVLVGAATNLGDACSTIDEPPAIYEGVITAGATDASDAIAQFSARGPITVDGSGRLKPDVSAPGVSIWSSVRGADYGFISGTSMAAPHVVGLVALLLDARPDLAGRVDIITTIVTQSALPRTSSQDCGGFPGSQVPNPVYGHGRIDALQMLVGDVDGDGVDNLGDCDPVDGSLWVAPAPAAGLTLDKTPLTELSWSAPDGAGMGTVLYDLLRGGAPDDFASADCLVSDTSQTTATDTDSPATIFYYLIRTENECGDELGAASDGTPRAGAGCPARP